MITGLIIYSFFPLPTIVEPTAHIVKHKPDGVLVAKTCGEVKRWYAWTKCGKTTCCKLFIACSNGTIVTQAVDGAKCR